MKVIVLGAGVIGVSTAWYLAEAGHEAVVVERQKGPGLETSFANGAQISVCHAEPWANPEAPLKILQWIWRNDAPLLFRLKMDPKQWSWGARFLYECQPSRTRENIGQIVRLSLYSRTLLGRLRESTNIQYDALQRGILHFYMDRRIFDAAVDASQLMRGYGLDREPKTADEAVMIEPALAHIRKRIVGATYTASDESGDAHKFTQALAKMATARGAKFLYGRTVQGLRMAGGRVDGVVVKTADGPEETLRADAYVVALGSYAPLLTRPVGVDLPIYPTKGYSASAEVIDDSKAPMVSVTDDEAKIVFSRLGRRLRIAGTAEMAGYDTQVNRARCEAIVRRAMEVFPGAASYGSAEFWTGLRSSTPSNVPIIGRTKIANLYLNTGHGTLGWTMACGSGRALADIISGRKPEVDFRFT